jgi:MFS transporter, DHA2 family, multidrug resistance protein
LVAPFADRLLADRYPAGILDSIGLAIVGVGFVLLAMLPAHPDTVDILWRIAVCGGGMGLFQQPNVRAIVMAADSGGSRPRIRDDVAQHSALISLGVPR